MRKKPDFAQKASFLAVFWEKTVFSNAKLVIFAPVLIKSMFNDKISTMKKVMFIAIALVAMVCISCTKTGSKDYYSYSTSFRINGQGNNTTELDNILRPKLNNVMQLTKEEAQTEWNGFLSSVSNITVTLNESSYYVVKFCRQETQNDQLVNVETIGTQSWGNVPVK